MPLYIGAYIYLIYTTDQSRVKGVAQEGRIGSLAVLGFEFMTFWSAVQCLIGPL